MSNRFSNYSVDQLAELCKDTENQEVWSEFVSRTHRLLRSTIWTALQRWAISDKVALDDLVQEVYLKLSANGAACLKRFKSQHEGAILGYLRSAAVAVAHDYCKARMAIKRGVGLKPQSIDEAAFRLGREGGVEHRVLIDQIAQVLAEVTDGAHAQRDQSIFWLYYRQGFTAKSISEIPAIELTTKGVESVIQRLTRLVRERLVSPTRNINAGVTGGESL